MNTAETSIPGIDRAGRTSLVVGLAGMIVFVAFGLRDQEQFFRSYLFAFVFWMGLPLGSITSSFAPRRNAARSLP